VTLTFDLLTLKVVS